MKMDDRGGIPQPSLAKTSPRFLENRGPVQQNRVSRQKLDYFGETFPTFLRSLGGATSIEYLADIASLEWARHKACYARPAVPVGSVPSSWLSSAQPTLRVALHPSVS